MQRFSLFTYLLILLFGCQSPSTTSSKDTAIAEMGSEQLRVLLDSIHIEDQQYRAQMDSINNNFGWESDEMQNLVSKMRKADLSNTEIVTEILDTHGWLSTEEIGSTANSTLFLVIQHADQEVQEKYLAMMQQAVKEGKARASSLALLEDRLALRNGRPQIYGSQIGSDNETGESYVLPMINPDSVNARRASVGLRPIEEYVKYFDLEWNLEAYKEKLPARMENLN